MKNSEFYKLCSQGIDDGHIYLSGEPAEGFVKALKHLRKNMHTIHICTARMIGRKDASNTIEWLQKHKVPYDSITFGSDKTIVDVDVFLEDKPKNFFALENYGIRSFLFDQPYNRDVDTEFRVTSWEDFANKVEAHGKSMEMFGR